MPPKILVTGAAGFIGSHLVDLLIEKKTPLKQLRLVIAPWDTLENLKHLDTDTIEIIKADIRDRQKMFVAVKGCSIIYHLAARIDFDGQTYAEYQDVNVDATQHLLDAAVKHGVRKFILYSSIGVFGLPAGIGDIEGWDETHPKTYTNFYGQSKWEAEQRVVATYQKHKLPYAIIRPASVYGPREQGPTLALYRAIKSNRFMLIGNGQNKMHYVFVKDLVTATYLAAKQRRATGDYIVAGPAPNTFQEIVSEVATSIDHPVPKLSLPTPVAMLIAHIFELLGKLFNFSPPLFPSRVRTMTTTYWYDISKAKKELKYRPAVPFSTGAEITGKWYQEHGYL